MVRSLYVLIPLACLFAYNLVRSEDSVNVDVNLSAADSNGEEGGNHVFTNFLEEGNLTSDLVALSRSSEKAVQSRIDEPLVKTTFTYTFGKRANGDKVVHTSTQNQQWTQPQNIAQNLTYNGATVTFVEIIIVQSTGLGRAYVVAGAVGQKAITVTIEAQKTNIYKKTTSIFAV